MASKSKYIFGGIIVAIIVIGGGAWLASQTRERPQANQPVPQPTPTPTKDGSCTDSDQGLNYSEFGSISFDGRTASDRCTDANTLLEVYCTDGNKGQKISYTCSSGCFEGKCATEEPIGTPPPDPQPIDPDPLPNPQPQPSGELMAFPGAEGYGAGTPGGRGGKIYKVTTLADSGPGSFREAVLASGPRIVVFETGGIIDLKSEILIKNPYLTIAGQTAPGDGILVKGRQTRVETHNVIIRGMRFRLGDESGYDKINPDALAMDGGSGAWNVIVDHNSLSWSIDEVLSAGNGAHDITFSWNFVTEGLHCNYHREGCHSKGIMFHSTAGEHLTAHHNVLMNNDERNPNVKGRSMDVINNLVYNYGFKASNIWIREGGWANIIGNHYIPGPDTKGYGTSRVRKGIYIQSDTNPQTQEFGTVANSVYASGNLGPGSESVTYGNLVSEWDHLVDDTEGPAINAQSLTPFPLSISTIHGVSSLDDVLLGTQGAGAIVPYRDPVDVRLIQTYHSNTGNIIDSQTQVGGWPVMKAGTPPADTDNDGMPNAWESANGTNPNVADNNGDLDGDGYTNIEEYINGFFY